MAPQEGRRTRPPIRRRAWLDSQGDSARTSVGGDELRLRGVRGLPSIDLVDAQESRQPRKAFKAARAKLSSSDIGSKVMSEFRFTLKIEGADVLSDAAQEALFEAGCGDATFGATDGVQTAEFDRQAPDFSEAVASAIREIEGAVQGAKVIDVHRDEDIAAPR